MNDAATTTETKPKKKTKPSKPEGDGGNGSNGAALAAPVPSRYTELDPRSIRKSKTNPRRSRDPKKDAELRASIREHHVIEPLIVRPDVPADLQGEWTGDLDSVPEAIARWMAGSGRAGVAFELVCGERRLDASLSAELATVPVIIRPYTDKQVLEVQFIENCQREDVHPMEEAEGFHALIQDHGYTAKDIAAKIGKSVEHVYQRLKLCDLCAEGREAFFEGRISPSVAVMIARIPDAKLQKEALRDLAGTEHRAPAQSKEAFRVIHDRYMLRLADAPFDKTDVMLVEGAGPCSACPKRTGNQRELFSDVKSGDLCTDPGCFEAKRKAHGKVVLAKAAEAGQPIIDSAAEMKRLFPYEGRLAHDAPYVDLDATSYTDPKRRTWRQVIGAKALKSLAITVAVPEDGRARELVARADAVDALSEGGKGSEAVQQELAPRGRGTGSEAERKQREKQKLHRAAAGAALAIIVAKAEKMGPTLALLRVALFGFLRGSWHDTAADVAKRRGLEVEKGKRAEDALGKLIAAADVPELCGLFVEMVVTRGLYFSHASGLPESFKAALELFKVDWAKVQAEAKAELRAKKPRGKKKPAEGEPAKPKAKRAGKAPRKGKAAKGGAS